MSRGIRHIESETSTVKATLGVHYSNTHSCSSCHRQAMKALTWQRKHLNEIVHIFHSSVWKWCHFKANSQHRLLRPALLQCMKHYTLTCVSLTFICLDNVHIWSLWTLRTCQSPSLRYHVAQGPDVSPTLTPLSLKIHLLPTDLLLPFSCPFFLSGRAVQSKYFQRIFAPLFCLSGLQGTKRICVVV